MDDDLMGFYQTNADFNSFLNKYCDKHKVTVLEALTHKLVQETARYYKDLEYYNTYIRKG